ncbi:MAG: CPBP family intramembrane glutamic endopeptidase [Candidatus Helarchaeota archaeon]
MEKIKDFFQSRNGNIFDIIITSVVYFYIILIVAPLEKYLPILISAIILGVFFIFYILFLSHYLHGDNWAERGIGTWKTLFIRTDNLKKSCKEVLLIITSVLVLAIFLISLILGTFWTPKSGGFSRWLVEQGFLYTENILIDFAAQFLYYIFWGFVQQILFLSFINVRLRKIFPDNTRNNKIKVTIINGMIFSCYHLFNIPLMIFTFIAGLIWSWSFYDTPNMFTVSISHGLSGTLSSMYVFSYNGWNMNVGWAGLVI